MPAHRTQLSHEEPAAAYQTYAVCSLTRGPRTRNKRMTSKSHTVDAPMRTPSRRPNHGRCPRNQTRSLRGGCRSWLASLDAAAAAACRGTPCPPELRRAAAALHRPLLPTGPCEARGRGNRPDQRRARAEGHRPSQPASATRPDREVGERSCATAACTATPRAWHPPREGGRAPLTGAAKRRSHGPPASQLHGRGRSNLRRSGHVRAGLFCLYKRV